MTLVYQFAKRIYQQLDKFKLSIFKLILARKQFKVEESIIIFSEPRGGSTWLMEILSNIPKTCINWEPFVNKGEIIPDEYKLGWRPYIAKDSKNGQYFAFLEKILSFSIHLDNALKFLSLKKLLRAKYVITKFVRGNLLIPYISHQFELKNDVVFLLRHPIDACLSQIMAFSQGDEAIADIQHENLINYQRFYGKPDFIEKLHSPLEIKIVQWCLRNIPTLHEIPYLENLTIVYYSDLLLDSEKTVRKVLDGLRIDIPSNFLTSIDFNKPSKTTVPGELQADPREQLMKNINKLDPSVQDRIQKIFDHFNFKLYNAYSPLPEKKHLTCSSKVRNN